MFDSWAGLYNKMFKIVIGLLALIMGLSKEPSRFAFGSCNRFY